MVTKEQERKALEQIRKIVAGLGEDSYIATAFEGCFEIAEENIDNDFACSMRQRAERAENEVKELRAENDRLIEEYEVVSHDNEQKTEAIRCLRKDVQEAKARILPTWAFREILKHYNELLDGYSECQLQQADRMAQHANVPTSEAFKVAVEDYRNAKEARETCEQLLAVLGGRLPDDI